MKTIIIILISIAAYGIVAYLIDLAKNYYYFRTLKGAFYVLKSDNFKFDSNSRHKAVKYIITKKGNKKCLEFLRNKLNDLHNTSKFIVYDYFKDSNYGAVIPKLLETKFGTKENILPALLTAQKLGASSEQLIEALKLFLKSNPNNDSLWALEMIKELSQNNDEAFMIDYLKQLTNRRHNFLITKKVIESICSSNKDVNKNELLTIFINWKPDSSYSTPNVYSDDDVLISLKKIKFTVKDIIEVINRHLDGQSSNYQYFFNNDTFKCLTQFGFSLNDIQITAAKNINHIPINWIIDEDKISLLNTFGVSINDLVNENVRIQFDEELSILIEKKDEAGMSRLKSIIINKDEVKRKMALIILKSKFGIEDEDIVQVFIEKMSRRKDIIDEILKYNTKTSEKLKNVIAQLEDKFPSTVKYRFWDVIVGKGLLDEAWKLTMEGHDYSIYYDYDEGEYESYTVPHGINQYSDGSDPWGGVTLYNTIRPSSESWGVVKNE